MCHRLSLLPLPQICPLLLILLSPWNPLIPASPCPVLLPSALSLTLLPLHIAPCLSPGTVLQLLFWAIIFLFLSPPVLFKAESKHRWHRGGDGTVGDSHLSAFCSCLGFSEFLWPRAEAYSALGKSSVQITSGFQTSSAEHVQAESSDLQLGQMWLDFHMASKYRLMPPGISPR